MPSGEMLIKLFENFKKEDTEGFIKIAYKIIEEEKQKNHYVLANKLKNVLLESTGTDCKVSSKIQYINFNPLPKDKDNDLNLIDIKYSDKTFNDIIINKNSYNKLQSIIEEYAKREILASYNLFPKTKILFCGPPGCGKTLCTEILASTLGLPILYVRFDSLISSYLGETARNIRNVFDYASKGNWVVFFDEFDAIGKSRSNLDEHGELKRVINSFLQLMDNFGTQSYIIAATNHEQLIDYALWRRFDEILFFDFPNKKESELLINLRLRCFRHKLLNIKNFISSLQGLSFADIEKICIDSIKFCIVNGIDELSNEIFKQKIDEITERNKLVKKITKTK